MPSALAITRSSGVVMKPRTRSAFAPTYTVETRTTAMSLRGYWRTLRERTAASPAMRITRLTTMERTGRLTKISVNFIIDPPPYPSPRRGRGSLLSEWRRAFVSASVVFRLGGRVVRRLDLVVDLHRGPVPELEGAGGHDLLAGLDAGEDSDLVAPRAPELHELLAHAAVARSLRVLEVGHHEHGVPVGRVADRGRGTRGAGRA